tara:strand:+ start:36 stop:470 length:435 start_codon:yes stop_codon:yes gene_type:complete
MNKQEKWTGIIDLEPMGKQRPRIVSRGRFTTAYTPKPTKDWTNSAQKQLRILWKEAPIPSGIPLGVALVAVHKRPQRLMRKKDSPERIRKPTKPDIDNVVKIVLDSLNGLVFCDDAQVCELTASQFYAAKDEHPHVMLEVWRLS